VLKRCRYILCLRSINYLRGISSTSIWTI